MLLSILLAAFSSSTLVAAAPVAEATSFPTQFNITDFSYGCTTTCDWSFSVIVTPPSENQPGFSKPVKCSGSTTLQEFKSSSCGPAPKNQAIEAYISKSNKLRLQYTVSEPKKGFTYWYYGHKHVNAETSGKPQPKKFVVKETSAKAIG